MTKQEYQAMLADIIEKFPSEETPHPAKVMCEYIASLEAENANLNDWLAAWKESLSLAQAEIAKLEADNRSLVEQMNEMMTTNNTNNKGI